ncbi:MAG: leucine--tRNA ligase [Candidatus Altiarchaeota archaeon]|nr:leucine--tRNA ligase [Candidatus Altiarchaeota archaeon]
MEDRWVNAWTKRDVFKAIPDARKKFYLTVAYPYPSGSMHVGHGRTYTVPDVIARFKRMQGYNVLFPMAWHVTGSPVLGIAERIKKKDPKAMRIYGELYKVPANVLDTFIEPKNIVKHFSDEYRENMTQMGFSIDWSRQFLTITPQYSKFVEWQYKTLHSKELVKKGEHPVRYCPGCDNPVGDHDLLEGENATINEFTVIKFRCDDIILPAATLRPETIFGVTNMWLNPDIEYVKANVGGETWLLSEEAAEKLKHAGTIVNVLDRISGEEFIGRSCTDPIGRREVPILPAPFVDSDYATGVVMSVPAHAPYDYVALRDLKSEIEPVSIIETDDVDSIPAKVIVEGMGIRDQKDKKLEEATEVLYRTEHAKGVMKKSIKGYGGMPVREAREDIIRELIEKGDGGIFYEFSQNPVVCRCGTRCYIKILKDQWFLEYSNPGWKEKTHECLGGMKIVPEETRQNFSYFIDWLRDWACTRRVGLGTKLPWDDKWLVEPLSDSTIYMAYYTISRHLKDIEPGGLQPEFFDFVFLGKGDIGKIAEKAGIDDKRLQAIRDEFQYWYPSEWRLSAKDLVGNHLTFHMFHHTALFPKNCWPKGIVVFGMGLLEGNKMSSSKGNIILLSEAIEKYGSDTVRLFLMGNAEPWQDFDWRDSLVKNAAKKLKQFYEHVNHALSMENDIPVRDIDRWLLSRVEESISETINALEGFQMRKALQSAFYNILNDLTWYTRRCKPNSTVLKAVVNKWVRLMAPFTPFVCEELWSRMGKEKDFVSLAGYPEPDTERIRPQIIQEEEMIKALLKDIQSILDVTRVEPKTIHVYIAPEWKWRLFKLIKEGKTIKDAMGDPEIRKNGKLTATLMQKTRKDEIPEIVLTPEEEHSTLSDAVEFLREEFKADIRIQKTPEYDPENKAKNALPMKPGIYIEA